MNDTPASPHPRDVRMRGFDSRVPVADALKWIDANCRVLPRELVPLQESANRVLADAIDSEVDVPGFDRGMMDGFALQAHDTAGASPYNPLELEVIGEILPGSPFDGTVKPHQAVRIMTGSPMPRGADAVLPVERTQVTDRLLQVLAEVTPGKNIGQRGEDVRIGDVVFQAGRQLRPQDVGVLSSIGRAEVPVVRRPRVRIVITGNELLPSGSRPRDCQIVDANGPMLTALVNRDGGVTVDNRIIPDVEASILEAMQDDVDVVLVSGGSSVGVEDHAPRILAAHGELSIHGIAMRPSSPTGMGRLQHRIVFLLPGNPVSCLCAYDFFAGRAIRQLGGRTTQWPYRPERLPLSRKLVSHVGRVDYARVSIVDGHVEPVAISGASMLSSTTRADGFVVIPSDLEGFAPGQEVEVFRYDT